MSDEAAEIELPDPDLLAMTFERDSWRSNAEFAGDRLHKAVQKFAQASAAQLQSEMDLADLRRKVAGLAQRYEVLRYSNPGRYGEGKLPTMGDVADAIRALVGNKA